MPPMELVWRVAYVDARTGDEVGNYELLVDAFKVVRLQRNPEAAFNFAQAMKEGIESFPEKAKYIFPEDTVFQPETIQMWFERSDSIRIADRLIFEAAEVEAESLLECLEEAGAALLEVLAV